jgi:glycosyltransferase involved in cell wall biosynthesis
MKLGKINNPGKLTIGSWLIKYLINIPKYKLGYYDRQILKHYKRTYHNSDAYGVLFDGYGEMLAKALGIDYKTSHIYTLQNPIPKIECNSALFHREKRIVYVGRLTYWDKRLDRLLAVWERLHLRFPDWKLSFIGDGPEEHSLRKCVADKNLQNVEFLGWQNNPTQFYRTSEIMCMTSATEGCPMALLEAQQCGCAAVAFDCCAGIHEILSPNWENGVLVPDGDIDTYAESLAKLMSDDELRHKIQTECVNSAKRFSVEKSVKQYDDLIKKLLRK